MKKLPSRFNFRIMFSGKSILILTFSMMTQEPLIRTYNLQLTTRIVVILSTPLLRMTHMDVGNADFAGAKICPALRGIISSITS